MIIKKKSKESIQAQVKALIYDKIRTNEFKPGDKIPSERELCVILGVSRISVRNAILELMKEGIVERASGQGTFVKENISFVKGIRRRNGAIGYVLCKNNSERRPLANEPFYLEVYNAIQDAAIKNDYHIVFSYVDESNANELERLEGIFSKIDGIIIEEATNPEFLKLLAQKAVELPIVSLLSFIECDLFDRVSIDLEKSAFTAVTKLLDLGHKRIGIINGPLNLYSAAARFEGYKRALRQAGIPYDENLVAGNEGWFQREGYAAMLKILEANKDVSAVFAVVDTLAAGALDALKEKGLKVPDDISLIGFDNTEISRTSQPPFASVSIPKIEMAQFAVKRLLERIEDNALSVTKIEFQTKIIENESLKPYHEQANTALQQEEAVQ